MSDSKLVGYVLGLGAIVWFICVGTVMIRGSRK
jgi:hypothetical protein